MVRKKPTKDDHMQLVRTAWPWFVGFWGAVVTVVVTLVQIEWVPLPAKAADLKSLQVSVNKLRDSQSKTARTVGELKEGYAASYARQQAIQRQLTRIEEGQDTLLKHLLNQPRQR